MEYIFHYVLLLIQDIPHIYYLIHYYQIIYHYLNKQIMFHNLYQISLFFFSDIKVKNCFNDVNIEIDGFEFIIF